MGGVRPDRLNRDRCECSSFEWDPVMRKRSLFGLSCALLVAAAGVATVPAAVAATVTTAWQNGSFAVDTPNLVRRSDIVLGRANPAPAESMALGNGTLGVAVWAAGGFTAQLN